jgi:hypothetical protein
MAEVDRRREVIWTAEGIRLRAAGGWGVRGRGVSK